jgi:signal transduction histidine kinase
VSFRARVLLLVALVALTAVGATAYLAYTQAGRQMNASAQADARTTQQIVDELTGYARDHGGWNGVQATVPALADRTGHRIRLVALTGDVVADSDSQARTGTAAPVLIDPRPTLNLPASILVRDDLSPWDATAQAITRYRIGARLAKCLGDHGVGLTVRPDEYGVPVYAPAPDATKSSKQVVDACRAGAGTDDERAADRDQALACRSGTAEPEQEPPDRRVPSSAPSATEPSRDSADAMLDCLVRLFAARTAGVAPQPLRLHLGVAGDPGPSLTAGPVAAAAAVVAVLALAVTAVLGRRVLRPIGTVTEASRRIGAGDLSLRVPARGRDELAELARSFNRMAESLQQAEDRQRRLIADIAHELRTPLANVRAYLEALQDGVFPPHPQLFANLQREALHQQRIIDDLQDLALAEAGALTYHFGRLDVTDLLAACRAANLAAADAAGIALRVDAGGPVVVRADPHRLRQVVDNLVSNALRATPSGGTVTLAASSGEGQAIIVVRDTGVGIPPSDLPHIFDRFWRADAARGRATGGSGLGLAIARQIISDHSGMIGAWSQVGVGTAITIMLPYDRSI